MKLTKKTKKRILAGSILVVLSIILTIVSVLAFQHFQGPVRLVNRYIDAVNNKNATQLCECFPPSYQENVQALIDAAGGEQAYFEQAYTTMFSQDTPYDSFGDNVTVTISDEDTESQTIVDGIYRGMDVSQLQVSAVSTVTCTMTTKGSLQEVSETVEVICVKIDGDWYMLSMSTVDPTADEPPTDT